MIKNKMTRFLLFLFIAYKADQTLRIFLGILENPHCIKYA